MFARLSAQAARQTPRAAVQAQARRAISVQVRLLSESLVKKVTWSTQSLLHGSPEAQHEGDIQLQQHSKLVARGKYVHGLESTLSRAPHPYARLTAPSLIVHRVKPDSVAEYKKAA